MPIAWSPRRLIRVLVLLALSLGAHVWLLRAVSLATPPLPAPPVPPALTIRLERSAPTEPVPPVAALPAKPPASPAKAAPPPRKTLPRAAKTPAAPAQAPRPQPESLQAAVPQSAAAPSPAPAAEQAPVEIAIAPNDAAQPTPPQTAPGNDTAPAERRSDEAPETQTAATPPVAASTTAETAAADTPAPAPEPAVAPATTDATLAARADATASLPRIDAPDRSGGARYRIHYGDSGENNVVAQVDYLFELHDGAYRLYTEGRASGLMAWFYRGALVQLSSGTIGAHGLSTQRYLEKRGERAARETSIDPATGEVMFNAGRRVAAPAGLQDKLSVLVQLALLRQAQPERFTAGAAIELPMLATSGIDHTPWQVVGEEAVTTDTGPIPAVKLTRRTADPRDPVIDVWLALDGRLFPVRLRATESNGRSLDQVLATR